MRRQLARFPEQVANRRQDFLHKLSADLLRRFDTVCIEDPNVVGMVRNYALVWPITRFGWAEFGRQREYKATWAGKQVRVIGRFAVSSCRCPCGYYDHDRDIIAVNNIKRFAFAEHAR